MEVSQRVQTDLAAQAGRSRQDLVVWAGEVLDSGYATRLACHDTEELTDPPPMALTKAVADCGVVQKY